MSWNYCAFSGEMLTEPMISKLSGHVFEKRVIEKYIQSTGQCPITQKPLTLDDLIPIQTNNVQKPKSINCTSVPQMLQIFQSEWDSLMLENYNLKQNLEYLRQELSYALYQHDAACRVISRLLKERDQYKKGEQQEPQMEIENDLSQLPEYIKNSIDEVFEQLNTIRKERRKDKQYNAQFAKQEQIKEYSLKENLNLNNYSKVYDYNPFKQLFLVSQNNNYICVLELNNLKGVQNIQLQQNVLEARFLTYENQVEEKLQFYILTKDSIDVFEFQNNQFSVKYNYQQQDVTSITFHPNGFLMILAHKDGKISYHDINEQKMVLLIKEFQNQINIQSVKIHPDGNLLGIGSSDGFVRLWNTQNNELAITLEQNVTGGVNFMEFSENGYILAVGNSQQILIFDLRKGNCIKTFDCEKGQMFSNCKFDQSANFFAMGYQSGLIQVLESKKWNQFATYQTQNQQLEQFFFEKQSKTIYAVSKNHIDIFQ